MKVQFTLQPFLKRSNSDEFLTFDSAMIEAAPRGSETEVFYTAFITALKLFTGQNTKQKFGSSSNLDLRVAK